MAQLTNEQWSAMSQEDRDRFLRQTVAYGKTITGRFKPCPAMPAPVRELQRIRRSFSAHNAAHGYETFDNADDMLLNADYAALERRVLESMTQEERDAIEAYEAERKNNGN